MVDEIQYRDNEKVLYKTRCKPILPKLEPGEVDCFVTESHIAVETATPIAIPLSCIRESGRKEPSLSDLSVIHFSEQSSQASACTAELVFIDDSGKERKLVLEMAAEDLPRFRRAVNGRILGTFIHEASERPSKTTLGKFFSRTKETFRDKTRDCICASLQSMGVDAILGERGQLQERIATIGGTRHIGSLGIIHVSGSPIRWVNVRKEQAYGGGQGSRSYNYYAEYGVPDPRLGLDFPEVQIHTARAKTVPLVGATVDLKWEGVDSDLGIIGRLNSSDQTTQPIMQSRDVTITAIHECGCWIMSIQRECASSMEAVTQLAPSRWLWDCYEAIAEHLLAAGSDRDNPATF